MADTREPWVACSIGRPSIRPAADRDRLGLLDPSLTRPNAFSPCRPPRRLISVHSTSQPMRPKRPWAVRPRPSQACSHSARRRRQIATSRWRLIMQTVVSSLTRLGWLAAALVALPHPSEAQEAPPPPPRSIPGVTADDPFPAACVSCHIVLPDGMDVRLSTLMSQWEGGVEPPLLEAAQASAPTGVTLTGRHPPMGDASRDIPAACLTCHGRTSNIAPPFARLMHRVHLGGGPTSIFLTAFQGECTYCHKLDLTSGAWSLPSASEP